MYEKDEAEKKWAANEHRDVIVEWPTATRFPGMLQKDNKYEYLLIWVQAPFLLSLE